MLKPIREEDIPAAIKGRKRAHRRNGPTDTILNFVESGDRYAEVLIDRPDQFKCVYATYYITAKRINAPIRVICADHRVFLVKGDNNA